MAPYRVNANWNISINGSTDAAFGGVKRGHVTLSTRIMPMGLLWHSLGISLTPISSFSVDHLVAGMNALMDCNSLTVKRGADVAEYSVPECINDAHRSVLATLTCKPSSDDVKLSETHRMIAPMGAPVGMDMERHGHELAGLITREVQWQRLSAQSVAGRLRDALPGKFERQFLVFHPACTFLYTDNPAKSEKYVRYIQKACFHNLREVVAMGLLQRYFLNRVEYILNDLSRERVGSLPEKARLESTIDELARVPLRDPEWVRRKLAGSHRMVFDKISASLGIGQQAQRVTDVIRILERTLYPGGKKVVSIAEQEYAYRVVGHLSEIRAISAKLADRDPFGFSDQVASARALHNRSGHVADNLKSVLDRYADLSYLVGEHELVQYRMQINKLVMDDYRLEILPKFEELMLSLGQEPGKLRTAAETLRQKDSKVPSVEKIEATLSEVSKDVGKIRDAKADIGDETEFSSFVEKAKPYVDGLLKVGRAILLVLGAVL